MSLDLMAVSHSYGRREVLREINLSIPPGTITALKGPSGSGKTTLLAIMGGLLEPTKGMVSRPDRGPGDSQWIHQTVNLLGRRSACDNVAVALFSQGYSRREATSLATAALRTVGLGDRAKRRANTLSGGEAQRVSIARALVGSPSIVLADEPTGQLDRATTAVVLDALVALRKPGSVIVVATHDPDVAAICDRVLLVANGTVTEGQ